MQKPRTIWTSTVEWDVTQVKYALRQLMAGNFLKAAQLADSMLGDIRIGGDLDTRATALLGKKVIFEPANGKRGKTAAKTLEDGAYWRIVPEKALKEVFQYGLLLGVTPVQHMVDTKSEEWGVAIKPWWPGWLQYDTQRRMYKVDTETGWFDLNLINPSSDSEEQDPNWSLFSPGGYSRPWVGGLVRRLAIPYLLRNYAGRDWARWSEKHGLPTLKVKVPPEWKAEDKDYQLFIESLQEMASEGIVSVPQGKDGDGKLQAAYDVEMLEAASQSWEGFLELKRAAENDISVGILGNLLSSGSDKAENGISGAIEIRQDRLESDAEELSTWLHDGPLKLWAESNFGTGNTPWPKYEVEPPIDQAKEMQTLGSAINNIDRLIGLGFDTKDIETQFGLKRVKSPEQVQQERMEQQQQGAPARGMT